MNPYLGHADEPAHIRRARARAQAAGDAAYRALPADATDEERQLAGSEAFKRSIRLDHDAELEALAIAEAKRARRREIRLHNSQRSP